MYDIKQITNYDLQDFDTEIINDIQYAVIPLSFLGTPIVKLGYCITNPSGIGSSFFIKINNEQYEIIMGETGMYEINMDVYYDSSGKHTISPAVTEVKVPKKYDFTLDYILIDKETYMAETTIKGSGISRWKSNKKYNVDDVVVYESDIYMCLEENQRKHFNKQDWEKIGGYKQNDYILPPASKDRLGGIKVGDGLRIDDGYLSVRNISSGSGNNNIVTISWEEYQSLSETEKNNGTVYYIPDAPYKNGELPIATSNKIGGIKVGQGLTITKEGVLSSSGGISPDNFKEEDFDVSSENIVSLNPSQRMVELTEAEYNALTVVEQNNGTAYLIKDGTNNESDPFTRTVITFETISDGSITTVATGITTANLVDISGVLHFNDSGYDKWISINFYTNSSTRIYTRIDEGNLKVEPHVGGTIYGGTVVLTYAASDNKI